MYNTSFMDLLCCESGKYKMQHQRRKRNSPSKRYECEIYTQFVKFAVTVFQIMVACQTITSLTTVQGSYFDDSKAYEQGNIETESLLSTQTESLDHRGTQITSPQKLIKFEPIFLNFGEEPIGMPKMSIVYIHNPSKTKDLNLLSIYANTANFHSSFFEKKTVPPGGNTSFEIVFLARSLGKEESTLFINTIQGTFKYEIQGVGIPNPYRLRPYIGAKVPVNTSFSPLINMHNPTNQTLQVTEMYSSSGYLQLQLPNNEHTADKEFWEIPPYETKCLMRACFLGQIEANHTAFIRIKTNQTDHLELHILPVEVEVSSAPGIYSSADLLDFGTLRSHDDPKTLSLFLLNSGKKDVIIQSISSTDINPAIKIEFKSIKLRPSETVFTKVANVTLRASKLRSKEDYSGNIVIKVKDRKYPQVRIPYTVELLEGTLGYDQQATVFMKNTEISTTPVIQNISITSTFAFPVVLKSIALPDDSKAYFKIFNFTGSHLLPADSATYPFRIYFDPVGGIGTSKVYNGKRKKKSHFLADVEQHIHYVELSTNASTFNLPLYTYSGNLQYEVLREDQRKLDFGIMSVSDSRQILIALYNRNPVNINVTAVNCSTTAVSVKMMSLTQGPTNLTLVERVENFQLPYNSCAVFEVTLNTSTNEQEIVSSLNIHSEYQVLQVPILAQVVIGALILKPAKVKLPPSFPGFTVYQSLTVTNTFAQMTKLESVTPKVDDKRFYFKKIKNKVLDLESNKKTKVGKIYFDPRQSCKPDKCYVGLPTSTTIGHHWLTTLTLSQEAVELDYKLYKQLKKRWQKVIDNEEKRPNTSMVLATNVALSVDIPVQAELVWPTLLEEETFQFPLTHIGKNSVAVLTLNNPADSPVIVQVLPLSYYPQPDAVLDLLGLKEKNIEGLVTTNHSVFNIVSPLNEKDASMVWLEYTLNGKLNRSAVNLFLNPQQRVTLKIEFMPYDDKPKSTIIIVRNNLTVVDALVVHGTGAHEYMKLGGEKPNVPNNILRVDLNEHILKDCKDPTKSSPNFTVRKSFTAKNLGLLPIQVSNILINNSPCEGYGFRIIDCEQFLLQPNATKTIHIVFTPDFTSSQIVHKLRIITAQANDMSFTLKATVPLHMLAICQEAIPRPSWESTLSAFITFIMIGLLGAVVLNAYLEAVNLWDPFVKNYKEKFKNSMKHESSVHDIGKPFDLQDIATNYISTIASSPIECKMPVKKPVDIGHVVPQNNSNIINSPLADTFESTKKFVKDKVMAINSLFSKSKRRRPLKKPVELKDTSIINPSEATNIPNNKPTIKHTTTKPHQQPNKLTFDNSTSHNLRRRTNIAHGDVQSKKNKSKHHHHHEATQNYVPPTSIVPETKFDPVLIAKESALLRGRKPKRESSSSSGSADFSEGSTDSKKKGDGNRKKNKYKIQRKDTPPLGNIPDDNSSTTTEKSSEDFDHYPVIHNTFEGNPKTKKPLDKGEGDNTTCKNQRKSEYKEKKGIYKLAQTSTHPQKKYKKDYESKSRSYRNKINSDSSVSYNIKTSRTSKSSSASCSSNEDSPTWEIPSASMGFSQDPNESMKILSSQAMKAENDMQKDFDKYGSPSKTNLSRHSSYSSIVSSSSNSDSNSTRQNNKSPAKEEFAQERKQTNQQRRAPRGQYQNRNKSKSQDSFYHTQTNFPTTANPVANFPSLFSQSSRPNRGDGTDQKLKREMAKRQSYPADAMQDWNPSSLRSQQSGLGYTAFGTSSLNIAESLLPHSPMSHPAADWNSSFSSNSSFYTTSPPTNERSRKSFNSPLLNDQGNDWQPYTSSVDHFQSRLSPTNVPVSSYTDSSPSTSSTSNILSTHSIWSVSNAVTMDEDRTADETMPVGLKSIWSSGGAANWSHPN